MPKKDEINYFDYKLHFTVLVITVLSLAVGTVTVPVTKNFNIILLPLIYSLIFGVIIYSSKHFTWISFYQSKISSYLMILLIGPLIAKLSILSGQNIDLLLSIGPVLILKEMGSLGSILVGLPIAIMLKFERKSIGMTSSICREPQMAVILDKYSMNSEEVKGFFIVYIIGTILGTPFVVIIVNILANILTLNPLSYALSSGIGSTSLNVAITSSLTTLYPQLSNQIQALSGISNIISLIFGVYLYMIVSLPVTEKLYDLYEQFKK